jgi:methionine-rich copper-binding protein CopC
MRTRIVTAALATAALGFAGATPALAHAPVKSRTPAPGARVSNVASVQVRFGESVVTGLIGVTKGATAVKAKTSGLTASNHAILRATFSRPLSKGRYRVAWRALADDGHRESGTWTFTVK